MIISIDESGTFVESKKLNSWCVVSAYVSTERMQSKSNFALKNLKKSCGASERQEIKLKHITEKAYFKFLTDLSHVGGTLFSVATDSYFNNEADTLFHKKMQAEKVRKNAPTMKYKEGENTVLKLANEIDDLPTQLYIQLQCQVELLSDLLNRSILYYVQRDPQTLRRFKWRIDQKNSNKTRYETAFENIVSPLLQTISFKEPMIFLNEADYSYMEPFLYNEDTVPKYIEAGYGKKLDGGVNIGDIIRKNMIFSDSKAEFSVQISDLLASGIRRCLRSGFSSNSTAAQLLGSLMVDNIKGKYPIKFVCFQSTPKFVDDDVAKIVSTMESTAKPMFL